MATSGVPNVQQAQSVIGQTGPITGPPPVGPVIKGYGPAAITSGSELNRTAKGGVQPTGAVERGITTGVPQSGSSYNRAQTGAPWPPLLDAGIKLFTGWVKNAFHDLFVAKIPANYGLMGGSQHYRARGYVFGPNKSWQGSIGLYPGPIPSAVRPEFNILQPFPKRLNTVNPANLNIPGIGQMQSDTNANAYPLDYTPAGTAQLALAKDTLL